MAATEFISITFKFQILTLTVLEKLKPIFVADMSVFRC